MFTPNYNKKREKQKGRREERSSGEKDNLFV